MLDFSGRVAIVTGAGQGLGRRYALDLARRGASVVVDDVMASLRVHLLGAFHLLLPAWQRFREQGAGCVVNTTSAVGVFGQRRSSVYAAGKMGVVGLTRVLADERVVALPGCAMDEIDLIRAAHPDLDHFRMTPR